MLMIFFCKVFVFSSVSGLTNDFLSETNCKKQGLEGYVYKISGNQMPSPDIKPTAPKGIKTILYIFELTSINQVSRKGQSSFYTAIHTKLIRQVETGDDGHFKVQLPAGHYSLFTKKNDLYYANWFDDKNNIAPAAVEAKKMTRVEIKMDYGAFY
jgi:hypothetical protein